MPCPEPNTLIRSQSSPAVRDVLSSRIFYGWWVVVVLTLVCFAAYGGGVYAFVVFVKPLEQEFAWSRAVTGGAVSIFWLSAVLPPFLGTWVDRRDPRGLILLGALIEGVCLMLVSLIHEAWQLYTLRAAMGVGKIMMLVPVPILLARWFEARKGIALGVALSGAHFGGLVLAPSAQFLIDCFGWREAAVVLGAAILVVTIPAVAIVLRVHKPSELGVDLDGSPMRVMPDDAVPAFREGVTLTAASRTSLFWVIVSVTAVYYLNYGGVLAHVTAYFTDTGVSPAAAAKALGLTAAFAAIGVLGCGAAIDRWNIKSVLVVILVLFAVGVSVLFFITKDAPTWHLYGFIVLFGLAIGGGDAVWVTLLRLCFGEKHYGTIWGTWYMVMLAALTSGPILVGHVFDTTRSYQLAFATIVASTIAGAVTILVTRVHRASAAAVRT